ncbi:retron St85 family RNA-directed DNA polymerase [Acerihabitans arboris]|uniref:RNA-directed DNA polymerase n=1 Tax=Acerihabitans arboris TaxID=2691583 RepID=A0A845SNW8_9GAMM|nr:retron St85 family RNA-directed DNA polymerase [Acerihabitans arboris]NDL65072.1 RNA-directed DNA polymerase [Acerihabitans arboris]
MNISKHLCEKLVMDEDEIFKFSITAPYRYKVYEIPKRNSPKKRTIAQPSKELKFIQRIIISLLKDVLPIHASCYAYRKNLSIKHNALVHLNTKYLLKMDFEDFFPSISPHLFFEILKLTKIQFEDNDLILLEKLLFFKPKRNSTLRLSIGAPSSPFISNFVMYFFDIEVQSLCDAHGINYSRYADDLTFSTNNKDLLFDMPIIVSDILSKHSFDSIKINNRKTIFSSKGHNRHVTGITLTNESNLSVGREKKRLISVMIHYFVTGRLDVDDVLKLQGMLSFARFVEPKFYLSMCKKYGLVNIKKLNSLQIASGDKSSYI